MSGVPTNVSLDEIKEFAEYESVTRISRRTNGTETSTDRASQLMIESWPYQSLSNMHSYSTKYENIYQTQCNANIVLNSVIQQSTADIWQSAVGLTAADATTSQTNAKLKCRNAQTAVETTPPIANYVANTFKSSIFLL